MIYIVPDLLEETVEIHPQIQKRLKTVEINPGVEDLLGEAYESSDEAENPGCRRPDRFWIQGGRRDRDSLFTLRRRHKTLTDMWGFGLHPRARLDQRFEPIDQTTPTIPL